MRQALPESGGNSARPRTLPAPVGGWNASDSIADMRPTEAVYLDNFFPRTSDVQLRKGFKKKSFAPAGTEVRTLMGYKSTTGAAKIFAAAQNGIFDITNGDPAVAATTSTKGAWEWTNISTAGGSFLLACNGVDKLKQFDGAVWKDIDGASNPAITGLATTDIVNISKFKTRVILCKKDSLSFWYLPNNAIAGAAVEFPLGALFQKGGYLMATTTWTLDSGNGPDDYFVAITSEGEVAVYKGTDPSLSTTFGLVGTFQLAKPMGRRCFTKLDGDTAVITQAAVYPLSKALGQAQTKQRSSSLSSNINRAYADFARDHADLFGWQIALFPEASMLLVNVPILNYPAGNLVYSYQFVMNTETGAWCRFTGMHSEAWLAFDGKLYFALHNFVYEAWTGANDNGGAITGAAKTAFSTLGSPRSKHVKMVRPVFQTSSNLTLQIGVDMDFADNTLKSSTANYAQAIAKWGEAKWSEAVWNGTSLTIAQWRSVNCRMGRTAAMRLRVSGKDVTMTWIAADFLVEDGDIF